MTLLLPIGSLFIDHLYASVQSQIKSGPYLCPGSSASSVFKCILVTLYSRALVMSDKRRVWNWLGEGRKMLCTEKKGEIEERKVKRNAEW